MSENNNGKRNRIPRGYTAEDTQRRLEWLKNEQGFDLQDLPANDPEELKGKFRSKKLDDINSRKVKRDEYIKAAKKTDEDELRKKY